MLGALGPFSEGNPESTTSGAAVFDLDRFEREGSHSPFRVADSETAVTFAPGDGAVLPALGFTATEPHRSAWRQANFGEAIGGERVGCLGPLSLWSTYRRHD